MRVAAGGFAHRSAYDHGDPLGLGFVAFAGFQDSFRQVFRASAGDCPGCCVSVGKIRQDGAYGGMEGDFLRAAVFPVVLLGDDMDSVRRKLAKESRGFLIFSDLFYVEDGIQLVQSLFRISIEGRYILFLLFRFGHGDGSFGHRALGGAFGVVADFRRDVGDEALFPFGGGLIAAGLVGVKGQSDPLGFVFGFVAEVAEGEGAGGEAVFLFFRFAGDDGAFEVRVISYGDVKAFFAGGHAAFVRGDGIAFDRCLAFAFAYPDIEIGNGLVSVLDLLDGLGNLMDMAGGFDRAQGFQPFVLGRGGSFQGLYDVFRQLPEDAAAEAYGEAALFFFMGVRCRRSFPARP